MDDYAEFSLSSAAEDKVYSAVTENIAEYWVAYSTHIGTRKYQQDAVKIPERINRKKVRIFVFYQTVWAVCREEKLRAI